MTLYENTDISGKMLGFHSKYANVYKRKSFNKLDLPFQEKISKLLNKWKEMPSLNV